MNKRDLVWAVVFCAVFVMCDSARAYETTNQCSSVEARICEGKIHARFDPLSLWAEWRFEWPESIAGVSSNVLTVIQRQMIDDCFGPLVSGRCGWENKRVSQVYPVPDKVLQIVFSRAYGKLDVSSEDDSPSMRNLGFRASLTIRFAAAGYIGYVLEGYENEGGNGCNSYVTARVMSLATGRLVNEEDFMTPSGLKAFPKVFFACVSKQEQAKEFVLGGESGVKDVFGNFVIEPDGIRWWVPPYSVFAGAAGVQDALMTWRELKPLLKPGKDEEFKVLFAKKVR